MGPKRTKPVLWLEYWIRGAQQQSRLTRLAHSRHDAAYCAAPCSPAANPLPTKSGGQGGWGPCWGGCGHSAKRGMSVHVVIMNMWCTLCMGASLRATKQQPCRTALQNADSGCQLTLCRSGQIATCDAERRYSALAWALPTARQTVFHHGTGSVEHTHTHLRACGGCGCQSFKQAVDC